MLRGDPKYKKVDMEVGAAFFSEKFGLRLYLVPMETERRSDAEVRKPNTGCRVQFMDGRLVVENKMVLNLMLARLKSLQAEGRKCRFAIDMSDPTGFWRAAGLVTERMITTFVKDEDMELPKTINVANVERAHAAMLKKRDIEEFEPLLTVEG